MGQRFDMNAGGGAKLPIVMGLIAAPPIALALRYMEHESWLVVEIAMGAIAVLMLWGAIWGGRMSGKAIEITDEGIVFPQVMSNEPETILWTGIEGYERGFDFSTSGGIDWLDVIYYGGRKRRIGEGDVVKFEELQSAICSEIDKRKPKL